MSNFLSRGKLLSMTASPIALLRILMPNIFVMHFTVLANCHKVQISGLGPNLDQTKKIENCLYRRTFQPFDGVSSRLGDGRHQQGDTFSIKQLFRWSNKDMTKMETSGEHHHHHYHPHCRQRHCRGLYGHILEKKSDVMSVTRICKSRTVFNESAIASAFSLT